MINAGRGGLKAVNCGMVGAAVVLLVLMLMVMGCTSEAPATSAPLATVAPAPTYTPLPTYTPYPTYTPVPTATSGPTPAPTATSAPPPTLTPAEMDRVALIALYEATGGPGWANSAHWASQGPLHQWYGVTVSTRGRVIELSLQENRLTGELPAELGDLPELRNLRLWSNELTGEIPPEVAHLTELEQFAVGGNRLHGLIPEWLADFRNLSELHMSTNSFTGPLPPWLGELPLRRLILGNNRFEGDIPEELGNLRNLRAFWLGGNNLTGCIPDELREVPDNDFPTSGVPFCADGAQVSAPQATPTPVPTKMPTPTPQPEVAGVRYVDDPEVPYLKWEIGPEVPDEQYGYLRAGIVNMHQYAASLDLPPLPDDATFYVYRDQELAARALARLERRSLERARRSFADVGWAGLAGLEPENEHSGWITVNLEAYVRYPEQWRYMRIAAHELSHVYQYTLGDLGKFDTTHKEVRVNGPAWMQEGFATFHSDRALAMGGIVPYEQSRQRLIRQSQRVDVLLKETETYDGLKAGPGRSDMAAMASELLAAEAGEKALITYWTLLGPDTPWQEAFETAFGMMIDEFYQLFEEHRAGGFPELDLPDIAPRAPLAAADREALSALYESAGGVYWAKNGNWLSDEPGSQWHGVATDPDGHVTVLNLRDNRLSGELPPELGDLRNLRELILRDNQLSGAIPPELGNLANLEVLSLVGNRLSGPIPREFGELTGLRELRMRGNGLSGEIPSTIANLTNLGLIYLGENELHGKIPDELKHLPILRYVNLNRNRLTGEIPAWLGEMPLRQLFLNDNRFTGEIPAELSGLSELEWLWLGGNSLTGCVPDGLRDVANNDLNRLGLPDC